MPSNTERATQPWALLLCRSNNPTAEDVVIGLLEPCSCCMAGLRPSRIVQLQHKGDLVDNGGPSPPGLAEPSSERPLHLLPGQVSTGRRRPSSSLGCRRFLF